MVDNLGELPHSPQLDAVENEGSRIPPDQAVSHGSAGATLFGLRDDTLESARQLASLLENHLVPLANGLHDDVHDQIFKIAIIGQVKAGKSSFINALSQKPGLLPTDVNPWTAVVTKVHFGSEDEQNGAHFQFFSEDEWHHIIGGGRLREIDSGAMPEFDREELHSQLEEIETRAKTRLGDHYPELLGKHHLFSSISPDVVERYVTAGEKTETAAQDQPPGHFSDITKSADLFLRDNPIGYPSIIIDTPGTNDPFLLRDQITLQNLQDADLYIVVVTAQQPLSVDDMNLLRLLRGVHQDRIVTFVNRIDTLRDIAGGVARVEERMRAMLEQEFPGADIPVLAGSAAWGITAWDPTPERLRAQLTPGFFDYARALGLNIGEATSADWRAAPKGHQKEIAAALHHCSGLSKMGDHLNATLPTSRVAQTICEAVRTMGTVAQAMERANQLAAERAGEGDGAPSSPAVPLSQLTAQAREVASELNTLEASMKRELAEAIPAFRASLQDPVETYARQQREALMEAVRSGVAFHPERNMHTLRQNLASAFAQSFSDLAIHLQNHWRDRLRALERQITATLDTDAAGLDLAALHCPLARPSLAPLSRALALDLDTGSRFQKIASRDEATKAAERLEARIRLETAEPIDALIYGAEDAYQDYIHTVLLRLRSLSHDVFSVLIRHHQNAPARTKESAPVLRRRAEQIGEIRRQLESIITSCATLTSRR